MRELGIALARWQHLELWFLLNRDLQVPSATADLFAGLGHLAYSDDEALPRDAVYHAPSPFEPGAIDRLWPPQLRRRRLVVTLHDLIPFVYPDENMPDPRVRRAFWTRVEIVRQADRVLSVSRATERDAIRVLGLRPERLAVTGGGVSDGFRPPESPHAPREALARMQPEIDGEYVLYTGGMDFRKNVGGLLSAYARLPEELRGRYKLVLVGRLGLDDPHGPFAAEAASLGISERVVFAGFVPDEELVTLYQAASLFVFPSLYEGFGLPVVEALACGAPVIAGANSSLLELVEEEARFDAADPASIHAALTRALTDGELRERLRRPEVRERFTWRRIAELTVAEYEGLPVRPRPGRSRRRILCVAPLSAAGAEAETTRRVLEELAERVEVDVLVDTGDSSRVPAGLRPVRLESLGRVEGVRGGYDETVYWLGNSLEYALPLHVLRRRPGIVVAYDVRLTELYASAASQRPDLEPRRLADALRGMYGDEIPDGLGRNGRLDDADAERYGISMAREAIAQSTRFFVASPSDLRDAQRDADAECEWKIAQLPISAERADESARAVADRLFAEMRTLHA